MFLRVLSEVNITTIASIQRKASVSYKAIIKQHGRVLKTKMFRRCCYDHMYLLVLMDITNGVKQGGLLDLV